MHSSDKDDDSIDMGERANAFACLKDEVMAEWRRRVTALITETSELNEPMLLNSLPVFYDNLVESLAPGHTRPYATEGTNVAVAHGRERANETNYSPSHVVKELHLLKHAFLEITFSHGIRVSHKEFLTLDESINMATAEAIDGYTKMQREKYDSFVTGLAHDLRNPLQVALTAAELINLSKKGKDVFELNQRIFNKIGEVNEMIEALLDAATRNSRTLFNLNITEFDMLKMVREASEDLGSNLIFIEGTAVVGYWSRDHMKRVLENLLSNAQKYGSANSNIKINIAEQDRRLLLSVHNNGNPIPKERQSKIFDAYQRLDEINVKGWGLGLSMVQTIVESHGGSIIVDSTAERGTTFTVDVPIDCRDIVS